MSHVQMVEFFNLLILVASIGASLAIAIQAHYEIKMARLECERKKLFDFQHLGVVVIRHELHKSGYYQRPNKDDCPPDCKHVLEGLHLICLVFVAADDHFNVTAYQMRCLEDNDVFDSPPWSDAQVRGRIRLSKLRLNRLVNNPHHDGETMNVERRLDM